MVVPALGSSWQLDRPGGQGQMAVVVLRVVAKLTDQVRASACHLARQFPHFTAMAMNILFPFLNN